MKNLLAKTKMLVPAVSMITLSACADVAHEHGEDDSLSLPNAGFMFVDYRDLQGGKDGVAILDVNPESKNFGQLVQRVGIATGALPHHLYFNRAQDRLYTTALGGSNLYEVKLTKTGQGVPRIDRIVPIRTLGQSVGEDIYFTRDGSRYYTTFMGGDGSTTGGSVVMFDARTNAALEVISAARPANPESGENFIMYSHGISANEDRGIMMVTSTIHPDLATGAGNTVTAIDMATNDITETYLTAESWDTLSAPVELLLLRDGLPEVALASGMLSGDIWSSNFDPATGAYGQFTKAVEGDDFGWSWPLEFYIHIDKYGEKELYVTFANPGVIAVYSVDDLPNMTLKRTLPAAAGAHHMVFFTTESGREVVVANNNLLNLNGLNAGTLTAVDVHTGELLGVVDLPTRYGIMPESIESAWGHGHDYHH